MIKPEETEQKKSFLDRLPRVGRASQLILLIGIFLLLALPMWFVSLQQVQKQVDLNEQISMLQAILENPESQRETLEAEIREAEADIVVAKAVFPNPDQGPEIINDLLRLTESNGIYITNTTETAETEKLGANTFSVLTFRFNLTGQVSKFQNFILELDNDFPTCTINAIGLNIAEEESDEDSITIKLNVFCYEDEEEVE